MFCARFIVANRDGGELIPGPVQPEYPDSSTFVLCAFTIV